MSKDEQIKEVLNRGVDTVYPSKAALEKRLRSGKKVKLYLGIDASAPELHIGTMVPLQKLRQFQQLGHKVILLVGDFTGQTGDPTDKQAVRVPLTAKQVTANAQSYKRQASTVLKFSGPNAAEFRYNSQWLGKLKFDQVAELAGHFTVQQMLERDMFATRLKAGKPISLREFLYPLMQGYDSVAMQVDLEVGGSDQTFNMLAGRKLVKEYLRREKFVLTLKLVTDAKGVKIGKTEGNAINIEGKPEELYGQIMSLPDEVIVPCLESCTSVPQSEVRVVAKLVKRNPRDAKMRLAHAIVREFQGETAARRGEAYFIKVFQKHDRPAVVPSWRMTQPELPLWRALKLSKSVTSASEGRRLITQGAVKIDGVVEKNQDRPITAPASIQIGKKKFLNVVR